MPETGDIGDDEYVAKLLAEDAKKSSVRYSSLGLSALLPRRPANNAPKPNTRFLKSIIRETDSHNAALKRKEKLEARVRLRRLQENQNSERKSRDHEETQPSRKRRRSDYENDQRCIRRQGSFRRKSSSERSSTPPSNRHRRSETREGRDDHAIGRRSGRDAHHNKRRELPATDAIARKSSREHRKRRRRRSLSHSSESPTTTHSRPRRKQRDRDRDRDLPSRTTPTYNLPLTDHSAESRDEATGKNGKVSHRRRGRSNSSSSDPLEEFVDSLRPRNPEELSIDGPVRVRGRGAYRASGPTMDDHFSPSYNPKLDSRPGSELEEEREDWDMALGALRDRQMWQQKQANRLREAGFDEADIKKWEGSGRDKDVEDVKWKGRGETREWDLGKNPMH